MPYNKTQEPKDNIDYLIGCLLLIINTKKNRSKINNFLSNFFRGKINEEVDPVIEKNFFNAMKKENQPKEFKFEDPEAANFFKELGEEIKKKNMPIKKQCVSNVI